MNRPAPPALLREAPQRVPPTLPTRTMDGQMFQFGVLFPQHHDLWRHISRCLIIELFKMRMLMLHRKRHFATCKAIYDDLLKELMYTLFTLHLPFFNFDPQAAGRAKFDRWCDNLAAHDPLHHMSTTDRTLLESARTIESLPCSHAPHMFSLINTYARTLYGVRYCNLVPDEPSFFENKRAAAITNFRQLINYVFGVGIQLVNIDQAFRLGLEFPYLILRFIRFELFNRELVLNAALFRILEDYCAWTRGFQVLNTTTPTLPASHLPNIQLVMASMCKKVNRNIDLNVCLPRTTPMAPHYMDVLVGASMTNYMLLVDRIPKDLARRDETFLHDLEEATTGAKTPQ